MHLSTLALGLLALPFALADSAPVINNNPTGVSYIATLPDRNDTSVRGAVVINTCTNGTGANVQVSISGLSGDGGPFLYHIHESPVAPNNNCSSTGAHLDPYHATESPPCDPTQQDKCQVGDLAGKHGSMTGPSFSANYSDPYLSTASNTPAFVGNRSIVVHFANKTRITCANFTLQGTYCNAALSPSSFASVSIASAPTVFRAGSSATVWSTVPTPAGSVISIVSLSTLPAVEPSIMSSVSLSTITPLPSVVQITVASTVTPSPVVTSVVSMSTVTPRLGVVVVTTEPIDPGQTLSGSTVTLPGAVVTSFATVTVQVTTCTTLSSQTTKAVTASDPPTTAVVVTSTTILSGSASSAPNGHVITISEPTSRSMSSSKHSAHTVTVTAKVTSVPVDVVVKTTTTLQKINMPTAVVVESISTTMVVTTVKLVAGSSEPVGSTIYTMATPKPGVVTSTSTISIVPGSITPSGSTIYSLLTSVLPTGDTSTITSPSTSTLTLPSTGTSTIMLTPSSMTITTTDSSLLPDLPTAALMTNPAAADPTSTDGPTDTPAAEPQNPEMTSTVDPDTTTATPETTATDASTDAPTETTTTDASTDAPTETPDPTATNSSPDTDPAETTTTVMAAAATGASKMSRAVMGGLAGGMGVVWAVL